MAQGSVVTIRKDSQVVMKIISGSDGVKTIDNLAEKLRRIGQVPSLHIAYDLAGIIGFGGHQNLVVMDSTGEYYKGEEPLSPLYRQTFDQPEFNPRLESGLADRVEIVDL